MSEELQGAEFSACFLDAVGADLDVRDLGLVDLALETTDISPNRSIFVSRVSDPGDCFRLSALLACNAFRFLGILQGSLRPLFCELSGAGGRSLQRAGVIRKTALQIHANTGWGNDRNI